MCNTFGEPTSIRKNNIEEKIKKNSGTNDVIRENCLITFNRFSLQIRFHINYYNERFIH